MLDSLSVSDVDVALSELSDEKLVALLEARLAAEEASVAEVEARVYGPGVDPVEVGPCLLWLRGEPALDPSALDDERLAAWTRISERLSPPLSPETEEAIRAAAAATDPDGVDLDRLARTERRARQTLLTGTRDLIAASYAIEIRRAPDPERLFPTVLVSRAREARSRRARTMRASSRRGPPDSEPPPRSRASGARPGGRS